MGPPHIQGMLTNRDMQIIVRIWQEHTAGVSRLACALIAVWYTTTSHDITSWFCTAWPAAARLRVHCCPKFCPVAAAVSGHCHVQVRSVALKYAKMKVSLELKRHSLSMNNVITNRPIIRGVYVAVDPASSDQRLRHVLHNTSPRIVLVDDALALHRITPLCHDSTTIIVISNDIEPSNTAVVWSTLADTASSMPETVLEERTKACKPNECCSIVFDFEHHTSPPGIMLSHDNLTWTAAALMMRHGLTSTDSVLSVLPLHRLQAQVGLTCRCVVPHLMLIAACVCRISCACRCIRLVPATYTRTGLLLSSVCVLIASSHCNDRLRGWPCCSNTFGPPSSSLTRRELRSWSLLNSSLT